MPRWGHALLTAPLTLKPHLMGAPRALGPEKADSCLCPSFPAPGVSARGRSINIHEKSLCKSHRPRELASGMRAAAWGQSLLVAMEAELGGSFLSLEG